MIGTLTIMYGLMSGIIYAGLGYLKSRKKEDFDPYKFGKSVMLGGIVGIVLGLLDIPLSEANFEVFAYTTSGTVLLDYLLKTIMAHKEEVVQRLEEFESVQAEARPRKKRGGRRAKSR